MTLYCACANEYNTEYNYEDAVCAVSKVPLYTLAHSSMYMLVLVFMSGLVCTLVSVCSLTLCDCSMERLRNLGIDPNVPKTDLISLLSNQSTDVLLNLTDSRSSMILCQMDLEMKVMNWLAAAVAGISHYL